MTIQEISAVVQSDSIKSYKVKFADGTTKKVKMWRHFTDANGTATIAIVGKGRRNHGHELTLWRDHYDQWQSITEDIKTDEQKYNLFLRRARQAQKMLEQSGLWANIKQEIDAFLELSEQQQRQMVKDITTDCYNLFFKEARTGGKYEKFISYQIFESFAAKTCFKTIRYKDKLHKAINGLSLQNAIERKEEWKGRWTNGYDCEVHVAATENGYRGWYSEEYQGCLNGHYYLLFSPTHAIFYEND